MRIFAALSLAIAAPPAFAAALSPASGAQPSEAARSAAELAKLVHPIELAVATAAEGSDRYLVQAMLKQPAFADMEKQYPGIMATMYQAGRPFMLEVERRNAHKVQQVLAELYQAELSINDLGAIRRFFSTGTGQKIVRGMFNPVSVKHTADVIARDPEADVSAGVLAGIQERTARQMAATMTAEDEKNADEFLRSSAGAKMKALTPQVQARVAQVVNTEDPELQSQIDSAMLAAAERFMAAGKK
jgi:hypothetical protein